MLSTVLPKNMVRSIVYEKYNGHCAYCGKELRGVWQMDHHYPKSHKIYYLEMHGYDVENLSNLLPSCIQCNQLKKHKPIAVWKRLFLKVYPEFSDFYYKQAKNKADLFYEENGFEYPVASDYLIPEFN